jgi:hypothetical protein
MGRRASQKHLPEMDIRRFEAMTPTDLSNTLTVLGPEESVQLLMALLKSYRLAATVANAAWKVSQESAKGDITPESFRAMQDSLVAYAPANFPPARVDVDLAAQTLEGIYDEITEASSSGDITGPELLELLFTRIMSLREGG